MKISDKEVQAALSKYYSFKGSTSHDNMRAALEAAYATRKERKERKERKAAKRAWNGKFEIGRSYRTRNGQKVTIIKSQPCQSFPLFGVLAGKYQNWCITGRYYGEATESQFDLIAPWA